MIKQRVFIAGHKGMVGSALVRILKKKNIIIITKNKAEINLLNQDKVQNFFKNEKIDQVYLAAANVGGIHANNTYPAEFIYQNLMIQNNIIHSAFLSGVKKLLFLGSSCIYPKNAKQPMKEEELLTGKLEPTNEPYAIAKIAGIKMCESYNRQYGTSHSIDFRSLMPTNLYGPGDNYHPENSHVIPGLINRFHKAKINNLPSVTIWGTGKPKREFLHVDDMADASIYVMNLEKKIYEKQIKPISHINIGSGMELTIKELAETIKEILNYKGKIYFDTNKLDGSPRKLIDSSRLNSLGWRPKINLKEGLIKTYLHFEKSK
ncbi:MAG: GDP-fucose synthetase [Candidatus Pelagibacter sp. TMED273]|nr:MAG: GDP-fucose synthetase [Candidatus Pelagibacter sp. TMED273]|tara:strand:+ start:9186 stop:10142 length:957 start_codon:yes stop_codon:yes gene_type:complete